MKTIRNPKTQAKLLTVGFRKDTGFDVCALIDDRAEEMQFVTHLEQAVCAILAMRARQYSDEPDDEAGLCAQSIDILLAGLDNVHLDPDPYWYIRFVASTEQTKAHALILNIDGIPALDSNGDHIACLSKGRTRCILRSMILGDTLLLQYSGKSCIEKLESMPLIDTLATIVPVRVFGATPAVYVTNDDGEPLAPVFCSQSAIRSALSPEGLRFWDIDSEIDDAGIARILTLLDTSGLPKEHTAHDLALYDLQAHERSMPLFYQQAFTS